MTVFDVVDFETLEQFIKEKNFLLNCFENQILQAKCRDFREKELFFLVKNPEKGVDKDFLMEKYFPYIDQKYSTHQIPRVAICNAQKDFWVKTEQFSHFSESYRHPKNPSSFSVYDTIYQKFSDVFLEDQDYQTLYEDEYVWIIVFLLRIQRYFYDDGTLRFHMEENGYYVNPNRPCDILPYDTPYRYSHTVIPYDELRKNMSPEEFQKMYEFYFLDISVRQRKK